MATQPLIGPPAPIGVKAKAPAPAAAPKTVLPPSQIAFKDLSGTYARTSDGAVINKASQAKFSNPADFFKDSGQTSFDNIKFDDKYTPSGKETIYGQPAAPATTPTPPIAPPVTPPTPTAPQGPYTPPNQGTTGVSQGGIIGNLLGIAQKETPEVTKARSDLKTLNEGYAKQTANIEGSPIDLSLANGSEGILNRLFAAKQGAAQTALSSALTSQGQQISATQGAGSLNAPIITPYGQQQVSPSQPVAGATTSGAASIGSLVGQRVGADGKTQEFFNTQTGQGFSNPQQLADFINQQNPGANANAGNVFQVLNQLKSGQGGNSSGGALNPINNVSSIAQQVLSGQISPNQAASLGGSVANWQGLLNQELQKQSGGSYDQSALQAKYDANQAVQGNQAQQIANYKSASGQAQNLAVQLNDLLKTYNLNPDDVNAINNFRQLVGNNTSDWRYQALQNYVNDLSNTYAQVLTPSGGAVTDFARGIAQSMLDPSSSGQSMKAIIQTLDAAVQAKIAGVSTPSTTGGGSPQTTPAANNSGGGSPGAVTEGTTAAGGALVFKGGKWVAK